MAHLPMPVDFPKSAFDVFGERAEFLDAKYRALNNGQANPDWSALAAATNGITYRWRALSEAQETFQAAFTKDPSDHEDRYTQDNALFIFFASGVSAIEQLYFAIYAFAALLEPATFDLIQTKPKTITPSSVIQAFKSKWPLDALTAVLDQVNGCQQYKDILELRNILSHRGVPPRHTAVFLVANLGGATPTSQPPHTISWTDRALDTAMLPAFRADLQTLLSDLFTAAEAFAVDQIKFRYPE